MNRNIHVEISDPQRFISDIENNRFAKIDAGDFWEIGYSVEPYHDYEPPEDFPNCCQYHKIILSDVKEWFNRFPNCCERHAKLFDKKWFKKELYVDIPLKVVTSVSYTSSFINYSVSKEDWYKEITDYINYVIESFGTPDVGGEKFFNFIKHWIEKELKISKEYEWKRTSLLDFLMSKTKNETKNNTDLNLLKSTFQKWVKFIPEIQVFNSIKVAYKEKLPMNLFLYDPEYNRFTRLTKFKGRTQGELIEILVGHTKNILSQLVNENIYRSLGITDKNKYEIQILTEKHRLKQLSLLDGFSKNELVYVKILKKWLENEKTLIKRLKPIFDKPLEQNFHSYFIKELFIFGQNFEKYKTLHNGDEEAFRDYFLPYLSNISKKHIATGETLNKEGKTDILIQDSNGQNCFIVECKLWKGDKYLTSAINQLLERYVLWRDTKVGIMIFNKSNKDFGNVITKAKKAVESHELCESFVEEKFETIITYNFRNPEDRKKIITLELILFNCFNKNQIQ